MECAEECYTLWAMNHMRNSGSMEAAMRLIQSCLHLNENERAEHYARHAMFMMNDMADNFISADELPSLLARGSRLLARSIYRLAESGEMPMAEREKAGKEAIELARQALELDIKLFGAVSANVAHDIGALANVLDLFNNVDSDEVLSLRKKYIKILTRVEGAETLNVAVGENQLGVTYANRANRALAVNDFDRHLSNLELALTHYREAGRIYRLINHVPNATQTQFNITKTEERIRLLRLAKAHEVAAGIRR